MNRRDIVSMGTVVMGAIALPRFSWAASDAPTILHIIRIQLAPGIKPEMRAQLLATINRFKQIHAPSKFIVGQDIAAAGEQQYDRTQVSFLQGEKDFSSYFNNPIHLAADKEASNPGERLFTAVSSFEAVKGGDNALPGRLLKIMSDRDAKYKANDTRPVSPPVPDRPEDQRWNYGTNIFRIVRINLSSMTDAQQAERLAALERFKAIKGVKQVYVGVNARRNSQDPYTHSLFVALENEAAYQQYMIDPIHETERQAGGKLPPGSAQWFDVIDPLDEALAERLRKFHAATGS
jgi:Stress responsive A/B Barrel Domain